MPNRPAQWSESRISSGRHRRLTAPSAPQRVAPLGHLHALGPSSIMLGQRAARNKHTHEPTSGKFRPLGHLSLLPLTSDNFFSLSLSLSLPPQPAAAAAWGASSACGNCSQLELERRPFVAERSPSAARWILDGPLSGFPWRAALSVPPPPLVCRRRTNRAR